MQLQMPIPNLCSSIRQLLHLVAIAHLAAFFLVALVAAQETPAAKAKRRAEALTDLTKREWTIEGTTREALVHIPAETAPKPYPLVFAFHGHGGTMQNAAAMFDYHHI